MKKIMLSVAMFAFAFNTIAEGEGEKYCVKKKDGVVKVMYKGDPITSNVTLKDGTVIKTDGTVTKKDGTVMTLNDGECIDADGKVKLK